MFRFICQLCQPTYLLLKVVQLAGLVNMPDRAGESLVFMLLLLRQVTCHITGPSQLTHFVGDNAHFRWNNTNNNSIASATWGIKKGGIPDPQFINVDKWRNKVSVSSDLEPDLMNRVSFDGDLNKGRAWFTLKNVTVNDTNEYLASISEDGQRVLLYTVVLTVKKREKKDKQNELGDITTKEPETNQVVHTLFPQIVNTATKETQVNVSAVPEEPANSISKVAMISITVIFAVLLLVVIAVIIICKKKRIKLDRRLRYRIKQKEMDDTFEARTIYPCIIDNFPIESNLHTF